MEEVKFGYCPRKLELNRGSAIIQPMPNYDDVVAAMEASNRVVKGWYYPPLTEEGKYTQVYQLDCTHTLSVTPAPDARRWSEFVIVLLGLLDGLRLIPQGWFHFYRTAIRLNCLSDVVCTLEEIAALQVSSGRLFPGTARTGAANPGNFF